MSAKLTRRTALQALAAGASLTALTGHRALAGEASVAEAYARSSKTHDWTLGWRSAPAADLHTASVKRISGKLPDDLQGTFYRNGPALFERDGLRLNHWFDGDGMVHAYRLSGGQVSHTGRMVRTPKYKLEQKAGRLLLPAFGTDIRSSVSVTGPDSLNVANTSVLPLGDEVLALWEGGSATRLQAETLHTKGFKTWAPELKGMPFSAHPKVETDGTIWNFGQDAFSQRLIVYKISASGKLEAVQLLKNVPGGMIHDFCITKTHLIFVAPSFRVGQAGATIFDQYKWFPDQGQRVIVVNKDDLTERREYDLPPGFQFHFGNAWEDKDGTIRYTACMGGGAFAAQGTKAVMRGEFLKMQHASVHHVGLYKNGKARIETTQHKRAVHEFPQFNRRLIGQNTRYLYTVGDSFKSAPGQMSVLKHNLESGKVSGYSYGAHSISEEHLFIPRPGGMREDEGWLIGTCLNLKTKATRLNIFDAAHIDDGPVAVFELPYALPLGFHGAWKGDE